MPVIDLLERFQSNEDLTGLTALVVAGMMFITKMFIFLIGLF